MSRRLWKVTRDGLPPIIDALDRLAGWRPSGAPRDLHYSHEQPVRIVADVTGDVQSYPPVTNGRFVCPQNRLTLVREVLVNGNLKDTADEIERRLTALQQRVRDWQAAALTVIDWHAPAEWDDDRLESEREKFDELSVEADDLAEWLRRTNAELVVTAKSKKPPRALTVDQSNAIDVIRERGPIPGDALAAAVGVEPETVRGWCSRTGALYLHGVRNRKNAGYCLPAATTPKK